MNILIKSARIIDPNSKHHNMKRDVLIKNGEIIKINKSIEATSKYEFLSDGTMILTTNYGQSIADERIWFISQNVRCRSSVIRISGGSGVVQTSFASEVRRLKN